MKNKSLMLTGAPGTGKTTIMKTMSRDLGMEVLSGHTTRPMRIGEVEGIDHVFISKREFKDNHEDGLYIESSIWEAWYEGYYYGTPNLWVARIKSQNSPTILISDSSNIAMLIKNETEENLFWAHLNANSTIRHGRLLHRGENDKSIKNRLVSGDTHGINILADINIDTSDKSIEEVIRLIINKLFES